MNKAAYEALTGHPLIEGRDNWKSLCPVHSEKTPSFYIHKDTYLCHCFGCDVRGYIENVLSAPLEMSPREIRAELDIPLLRDVTYSGVMREEPPSFELSWLSAYKKILTHPFLERRGFREETILYHEARWDAVDERIVFPIRTLGGPPIGAVGRTVRNAPRKWYYYWNISKSQILYSQTLDGMEDAGYLILVEGIFDVMWLNQWGYYNAAAPIAASCTKEQINLIKGITDHVVLFLDNDEAGRRGQEKIAKALKGSVQVSYALYPKYRNDPQELTEDEVHTAIGNSLTHVQFVNTNR